MVTIDKPETTTYYIVTDDVKYQNGCVTPTEVFTSGLADSFDTETTNEQTYLDQCVVLGLDPNL